MAPLAKCFPISESGEASEVKIYKHIPEYKHFQVKKKKKKETIKTTVMALNLKQYFPWTTVSFVKMKIQTYFQDYY